MGNCDNPRPTLRQGPLRRSDPPGRRPFRPRPDRWNSTANHVVQARPPQKPIPTRERPDRTSRARQPQNMPASLAVRLGFLTTFRDIGSLIRPDAPRPHRPQMQPTNPLISYACWMTAHPPDSPRTGSLTGRLPCRGSNQSDFQYSEVNFRPNRSYVCVAPDENHIRGIFPIPAPREIGKRVPGSRSTIKVVRSLYK